MSQFISKREQVQAADLRGPRVYSTDLLVSADDLQESVTVTSRALKIKLITKGVVTLNAVYLLSPLAMAVFDVHPDVLSGPGILPAFRVDKNSLSDLLPSLGRGALDNVDPKRIADHIARVEQSIA